MYSTGALYVLHVYMYIIIDKLWNLQRKLQKVSVYVTASYIILVYT